MPRKKKEISFKDFKCLFKRGKDSLGQNKALKRELSVSRISKSNKYTIPENLKFIKDNPSYFSIRVKGRSKTYGASHKLYQCLNSDAPFLSHFKFMRWNSSDYYSLKDIKSELALEDIPVEMSESSLRRKIVKHVGWFEIKKIGRKKIYRLSENGLRSIIITEPVYVDTPLNAVMACRKAHDRVDALSVQLTEALEKIRELSEKVSDLSDPHLQD